MKKVYVFLAVVRCNNIKKIRLWPIFVHKQKLSKEVMQTFIVFLASQTNLKKPWLYNEDLNPTHCGVECRKNWSKVKFMIEKLDNSLAYGFHIFNWIINILCFIDQFSQFLHCAQKYFIRKDLKIVRTRFISIHIQMCEKYFYFIVN